jgi:tubulin-specific chaperone A
MEADSADPYDIKRFKEVLAESVMMVPDSKGRLGKAVEDLEVRRRKVWL